jgi:two-component system CheB/CheR fusion protein
MPDHSRPAKAAGEKPPETASGNADFSGENQRATQADFPVVGLGASAGGLEALGRFLDALPPQPMMAFLLVQHLDPQHESMMADLLSRHTRLAVHQATNGMQLQPGHVFVIPPGSYLSVEGNVLRLSPPRERHGSRMPFDFLLHSLADQMGPRAMGVVLSGTGMDGTKGLADLRSKGGFAIAQDPNEAAFDGMPYSAIAAGVVDMVLPVAEIPAALIGHARLSVGIDRPTEPEEADKAGTGAVIGTWGTDASAELATILALLHTRSSHSFSQYKHGTLQRRIERRMGMLGIAKTSLYMDRLRQDPNELDLLAEDMLINVTRFFRDPKAFEMLGSKVIPELVEAQPAGRPLRIWVAGCSTGEEVYSIAIMFLEEMANAKHNLKLQIFASDIDEDAVIQAREGLYPASIAADITPERLARFFIKEEDRYRVVPELRGMVVFTVQDLLTDPPFSRLDLVSCRNLLIYLQPEAQEKVLLLFHFALREGGILLLGGSETVGSLDNRFTAVSKSQRMYRRIGHSRPGEVSLPIGGSDGPRALWLIGRRANWQRGPGLAELTQRVLLEAYAPASVVIDRSFAALHFSGAVDRYLRVSSGEPSRDLLGLARDGLRSKLRDAVQRAAADRTRVEIDGVRLKRDDGPVQVRIVVQPIPANGTSAAGNITDGLLLVSFFDEPMRKPPVARPEIPADLPRVAELEQELDATRRELHIAVHDLEVSTEEQRAIDEEAMSVNEEFQSTNEELVTSKEELQSLNEELTALNSQLQETLERQRNTSNDMRNILDSAGVATLFLDRDLNIRFFTPAMTSLFKIIPGDIGRPLSDLSILAAGEDLARDAKAVLAGGAPVQHQHETAEGAWFLRGVLPYRTQEGRVEGVIVTFSDITTAMLARRDVDAARSYAESIIETIRQPLVVLDSDYHILSGNLAFFTDFGLDRATAVGGQLRIGADKASLPPGLRGFLDRVSVENAAAADYEVGIDIPGRGTRRLAMHARWIPGGPPGERRILLVIQDITDQKLAAEALLSARVTADRANLGKSRFLASASHDLRQPLQTIRLLRGLLEQKISDTEALELLNRLDDAVTAMADILNTLLDINEIESGVVRPNVVNFPVAGLLERLGAEFAFHAKADRLEWRVVRSSLSVRSDPRLLEQMIRNLLSNALKYTAKNHERSAPGRVLMGCRRQSGKLLLQVWDTGPGIPDAQLGAIFEEFYQVDNPARERRNGLGLGLSIVRRLADLLGHPVRVESRVGSGSVFTIELPLAHGSPNRPLVPSTANARKPTNASTILLVEDDPTTRELLEMLLVGAGYNVAAAPDGWTALDMATTGVVHPDLVIADFNLPNGATGVETIAQLRQRLRFELPAIVLTGDIAATTLREIANNDCRHLAKPVDTKELLHAIRQHLENSRLPIQPAVQAAPQIASGPTGAGATVHVIDDDPALASTMRYMLSEAGYSVVVFDSSEAFLKANPGERRGCLVLDEKLPGMTGLALLRQLQAEGRGPTAIMMTAHGDVRTAVEAMRAGAVDFIEKPATRADVLAAVARALEGPGDGSRRAAFRQQASALRASMTPRQREIMDRVLAGQPSKNIAADLNLSQRTVENHRALIMKKAGARSIPQLVRVALAGS